MNDFAPQQQNIIYQDTYQSTNTNKNKQDMSFFGAMKRRFQDDNIIFYLKPEQIQKYAKDRIFREMVRGSIDYTVNGSYFQDPKFLENLIIAAQDELVSNTIIRDALNHYNYYYPQDATAKLLAKYTGLVYVLNVIYNKLNETKFTGNIGQLTQIQYVLKDYINII